MIQSIDLFCLQVLIIMLDTVNIFLCCLWDFLHFCKGGGEYRNSQFNSHALLYAVLEISCYSFHSLINKNFSLSA